MKLDASTEISSPRLPPAACTGDTQFSCAPLTKVDSTVVLPKRQRYARPFSKRKPYTCTAVLPSTGPLVGLKDDTRGAIMYAYCTPLVLNCWPLSVSSSASSCSATCASALIVTCPIACVSTAESVRAPKPNCHSGCGSHGASVRLRTSSSPSYCTLSPPAGVCHTSTSTKRSSGRRRSALTLDSRALRYTTSTRGASPVTKPTRRPEPVPSCPKAGPSGESPTDRFATLPGGRAPKTKLTPAAPQLPSTPSAPQLPPAMLSENDVWKLRMGRVASTGAVTNEPS